MRHEVLYGVEGADQSSSKFLGSSQATFSCMHIVAVTNAFPHKIERALRFHASAATHADSVHWIRLP